MSNSHGIETTAVPITAGVYGFGRLYKELRLVTINKDLKVSLLSFCFQRVHMEYLLAEMPPGD